jgi:hypothetical protein
MISGGNGTTHDCSLIGKRDPMKSDVIEWVTHTITVIEISPIFELHSQSLGTSPDCGHIFDHKSFAGRNRQEAGSDTSANRDIYRGTHLERLSRWLVFSVRRA